jgi:hypothetical protein
MTDHTKLYVNLSKLFEKLSQNALTFCVVSATSCFGPVGDMTRCRVGQGVQNDTTCRLFPTCRLNVGSSVTRNSAQTYSIRIIHISLLELHPYDP